MVEKAGSTYLFLYAEDLKIYNEIESVDAELLQQDLDRLYDCMIQTSTWQRE